MNNVEVYIDIVLFNVEDGNIKVLLKNNNIIRKKVSKLIDINSCVLNELNKYINVENSILKQCYTYSKIEDKKIILDILYIGIINGTATSFDSVDKCNNKIIEDALKYFKEEINKIENLKKLYIEFSLPELQKIFIEVSGKEIDRRNFRKRLIKLNIIESLDKMSDNKKGRPSKLYKFKEGIDLEYLL